MTTIATDLDRELDDMANRELLHDEISPSRPLPAVALDVDEKNLGMLTHLATVAALIFSGGLLHVIVPAVAYVAFRDKGEFLRTHAKNQLNFQITSLIVAVAAIVFCVLTLGIGLLVAVPALLAFFLVDIVCTIRAALAASRGEHYQFPFSLDLVQ